VHMHQLAPDLGYIDATSLAALATLFGPQQSQSHTQTHTVTTSVLEVKLAHMCSSSEIQHFETTHL